MKQEGRARLLNGPYLLAPKCDGMTIAWEAAEEAAFRVSCTAPDGSVMEQEAAGEKERPSEASPGGAYVYHAALQGLSPATRYDYAVWCGAQCCARAQFSTLQDAPKAIRLMTVSDTHLFHAAPYVERALRREKPAFLLHTGDISFGTGYQHDQYHDNWFAKIPALLAELPVFYTHGNHDDGPFYDSFFSSVQGAAFSSPDGGHTYSFSYGPAHFTVVDSNPWGLLEMNAANAGLAIKRGLRERIDALLAWAEADLTSEAARRAAWRVLVMHHPYTDALNNQYIVPIAERCGVNLMIGGHLHYYIKAVSVQPEIGARTVYVCQGSAQDAEARRDAAREDVRLLTEYPEAVAVGRNNYGVLDITEEAIDYRLYGFEEDGKDTLVDAIHMTKDEPRIRFSDVSISALGDKGHVEVHAMAKNEGTGIAAAVLRLVDNGQAHWLNLFGHGTGTQLAVLDPGESRRLTLCYTAEEAGEHAISAEGAEISLKVAERAPIGCAHAHLALGEGKDVDCLFARVELTNRRAAKQTVSLPLRIDGALAQTKEVRLRPHEKRAVTFCHRFTQSGSHAVSVAGLPEEKVEVEGAVRIVPRIADQSGKGHTVLLHGTPRLIQTPEGTAVDLEHYGDYIEILPRADLATPNGLTGMVWANINRLAHADEMGHNPLMVRGKSIGWGAGYAFRIAVERKGAIKWGICHDGEEYFWQGGDACVGKWRQYVLSFDKERGGRSFCDGVCRGRIDGLAPEAKLCQMADQPIFVGFSFIGHVIPELGKPKYFTHLPARIRQVRFYTEGLTEKEVEAVYARPNKIGPREDALAVWLDFASIETRGAHCTEWRHPAVYAPAFRTEQQRWRFEKLVAAVRIPKGASIHACIELSDNESVVKESRSMDLHDGMNEIALDGMQPATFLRIATQMEAHVGEAKAAIPELVSYSVSARRGADFAEMTWSTRADWERGTFSGAAGFPPVDRLRDYPEYTDIIHG
ncbi:MAG: metallophosphoesterase family protein [Mitsuokella sp.]